MSDLLGAERRLSILDLANKQRVVRVEDLAARFGVSVTTVRRDLNELTEQGLLQRTFGGAMLPTREPWEVPQAERIRERHEQKERIGLLAASLVHDSETIIVDSGTTTLALARGLSGKQNVTVITNDVVVAKALGHRNGVKAVLTGGFVSEADDLLVGMIAEEVLSGLHAHRLFLAATGLTLEQGATHGSAELVPIKRAMIRAAQEVVLLMDSSKIGRLDSYEIVPLSGIDILVTDAGAPAAFVSAAEAAGVRVLIVGREETPVTLTRQTGVTLRILALHWPQAPAEQRRARDVFARQSGIDVEMDILPLAFCEATEQWEWAAKSDKYDLYVLDSQFIGEAVAFDALERLDTSEYLLAPDAKIRIEDFHPNLFTYLCRYPTDERKALRGEIEAYRDTPVYCLPWSINTEMLAYREDLLEEAGFVDADGRALPPRTWDELLQYALALNRPPERYGLAIYAGRMVDMIGACWQPILWSMGGEFWDYDRWTSRGIVNSAAARRAAQYLVDLHLKHHVVDPESANWDLYACFEALREGRAAMAFNWNLFFSLNEDPVRSKVVGKVKAASLPGHFIGGRLNRAAPVGIQPIGINHYSKHKREAWQYLQWLRSHENDRALVDDPSTGFVSPRLDLTEYSASKHQWNAVFLREDLPHMRDWWNTPNYAELINIVHRELHLAYVGAKPVGRALDDMATAMEVVYQTSPYNPTKQHTRMESDGKEPGARPPVTARR